MTDDQPPETAGEEATVGMVSLPRVLSAAAGGNGGLGLKTSASEVAEDASEQQESDSLLTAEKLRDEVLSFPTNCPECNAPAATNMKVTSKCAD